MNEADVKLIASAIDGDLNLLDSAKRICLGQGGSERAAARALAHYLKHKIPQEEMTESLHQLLGAVKLWRAGILKQTAELCATIPWWLQGGDSITMATTETALINVILHAHRSLRLVTPFLDASATAVLRQISFAWERGCTIRMLCRRASAVQHLLVPETFKSALLGNVGTAMLRTARYGTARPWTFHAKILVADESTAYLGSANLTRSSLHDQAELGVLIRDPKLVGQVTRWFSLLWNTFSD